MDLETIKKRIFKNIVVEGFDVDKNGYSFVKKTSKIRCEVGFSLEEDYSVIENEVIDFVKAYCFWASIAYPEMDTKSLDDVQNVILTGWLLNCFNPSSAKYLEPEDFKYPYIRKIIYAIGAQPQPESLLALEKLASETDDEKIKELALHQLEKRK